MVVGIHTPGHTAGRISLFRDDDRTRIVGDAFCTTKPEARDAVAGFSALGAACIAPGHGQPVSGPDVAAQLRELASRFDELARRRMARYVEDSVRG